MLSQSAFLSREPQSPALRQTTLPVGVLPTHLASWHEVSLLFPPLLLQRYV